MGTISTPLVPNAVLGLTAAGQALDHSSSHGRVHQLTDMEGACKQRGHKRTIPVEHTHAAASCRRANGTAAGVDPWSGGEHSRHAQLHPPARVPLIQPPPDCRAAVPSATPLGSPMRVRGAKLSRARAQNQLTDSRSS